MSETLQLIKRVRHDRVLMEKLPEKDYNPLFKKMQELDFAIPETSEGKAHMVVARVLKKGISVDDLEENEVVMFQNGAGIDFELKKGDSLTIIRESDLMIVLND